MTERLDCNNCEFSSQAGQMCGQVARRAVAEVATLGYDTSSDTRSYNDIVTQLGVFDPRVTRIAEQECDLRLLRGESMRQGYGTVTY